MDSLKNRLNTDKSRKEKVVQNSLRQVKIFGAIILSISVMMLFSGVKEYWEFTNFKKDAVAVDATIYQVTEQSNDDSTDYEVYFSYNYNGTDYSYMYYNYPGNKTVGEVVTAYIHHETPHEVYIFHDSIFMAMFFMAMSVFVLWAASRFSREFMFKCSLCLGIIIGTIGLALKYSALTGGGAFFIGLAVYAYLFGKTKKVIKAKIEKKKLAPETSYSLSETVETKDTTNKNILQKNLSSYFARSLLNMVISLFSGFTCLVVWSVILVAFEISSATSGLLLFAVNILLIAYIYYRSAHSCFKSLRSYRTHLGSTMLGYMEYDPAIKKNTLYTVLYYIILCFNILYLALYSCFCLLMIFSV